MLESNYTLITSQTAFRTTKLNGVNVLKGRKKIVSHRENSVMV